MQVERIYIATPSGGLQTEQVLVQVVAGAGITGDRYFGRHEEPGQNITLIEAEEFEAFLAEAGRPPDLSLTHRNLVTRGVRLNALVGQLFWVGEVQLRGVELCQPCGGMGAALASAEWPAAAVVKRWLHRAGLRADVVVGGTIARGARLGGIA